MELETIVGVRAVLVKTPVGLHHAAVVRPGLPVAGRHRTPVNRATAPVG